MMRRDYNYSDVIHIPAKTEETVVEVYKLEVGGRDPEIQHIHEQLATRRIPYSVMRT